jgi:ribosomal-protein-alanine N-acetyltransferase
MEISTERTIVRNFTSKDYNDLFEYCFNKKNVHRIVANCNPVHQKPWKLAEGIGLKRDGVLEQNIYFKEINGKPVWQNKAVYGIVNKTD